MVVGINLPKIDKIPGNEQGCCVPGIFALERDYGNDRYETTEMEDCKDDV